MTLALTGTSDTGSYSAAINADSAKVTVYTQDVDNIRVIVFPLNTPAQRWFLESPVTPVTAPTTTINILSAATQRGAPGAPTNDSLPARAFAAYDAMLTYWFQATAMIWDHPPAGADAFPRDHPGSNVALLQRNAADVHPA